MRNLFRSKKGDPAVGLLVLLVFFLFLTPGCGGQSNKDESQSRQSPDANRSDLIVETYVGNNAQGSSKLLKTGVDGDNVASVTLEATWDGGSSGPEPCSKTEAESPWRCSLEDLPSGIAINLLLIAADDMGKTIFEGKSLVTLQSETVAKIIINMLGSDENEANHAPALIDIYFDKKIAIVGEPLELKIKVFDGDGDELEFSLTNSSGGGFEPSEGSVVLGEHFEGEISTVYTAEGEGKYTDEITLLVNDGNGASTTYHFNISVVEQNNDGAIEATVNFPPVIKGISAEVIGEHLHLTANVSDDGELAALSYFWQIKGRLSGRSNPLIILNPEGETEIKITVTDGEGALAEYVLMWGQNTFDKMPNIVVSPLALRFHTTVGQMSFRKFRLKNNGRGILKVQAVQILENSNKGSKHVSRASRDSAPFELTLDPALLSHACSDLVDFYLKPFEICFIGVKYNPQSPGQDFGHVSILSNDQNRSSVLVGIKGKGTLLSTPGGDTDEYEDDDDHS